MNTIKLDAIDSTNTYLKNLAKNSELPDETIVVVKKQLAGRGQMDAVWISQEGLSLTFSMFKQYNMLDASQQFAISMAVSLGLKKGLRKLNIPRVSIKWPNDIMSAHKKVAGILIENVLENNYIRHSIIGIGLNVNETDFPNLPQATSMYLEKGNPFSLDEVLEIVAISILEHLKELEPMDYTRLKNKYEKNLFKKDIVSVFENTKGVRFNGIIKGIDDTGELVIETEESILKKYRLKEIKLVF